MEKSTRIEIFTEYTAFITELLLILYELKVYSHLYKIKPIGISFGTQPQFRRRLEELLSRLDVEGILHNRSFDIKARTIHLTDNDIRYFEAIFHEIAEFCIEVDIRFLESDRQGIYEYLESLTLDYPLIYSGSELEQDMVLNQEERILNMNYEKERKIRRSKFKIFIKLSN